jgi:hypothetical protein
VVVHPRAEERDLVVRARVARRERAEMVVHVLLGHAGRQIERAVEPDLVRHLGLEDLVE